MRQTKFDRKWWYCPPVLSINFFVPGNFLKHSTERVPHENFVTERQKTFDGNSWNSPPPPPPLIQEHFRYRKFWETQHRRVSLRKVSVLWDEKNSTEKRQLPFLSLTFFEIRSWWSTKGFPYKFFRHCETKKFRRKILIFPTLVPINFFATGSFLKHSKEVFPYEIFRHRETKKFDGKT